MTVTRSTSRGSASATAALNRRTACEPPKMRRTRSSAAMPSRCRAATRSMARDVADRRPGHVARPTGRRAGQRPAGRLERDGQRGRQPGRGADRPAGDDVAVPQDDRDAERGGRQEDRDRDVAAGREDRRRSLADAGWRPPAARTGRAGSGRGRRGRRPRSCAASARRAGAAGCPAAGTSVASRPRWPPSQRSSGASGVARERARDGQRRVDVSARSARRDQQSHRRSTSPSPRSRARSRGGSRPPRS